MHILHIWLLCDAIILLFAGIILLLIFVIVLHSLLFSWFMYSGLTFGTIPWFICSQCLFFLFCFSFLFFFLIQIGSCFLWRFSSSVLPFILLVPLLWCWILVGFSLYFLSICCPLLWLSVPVLCFCLLLFYWRALVFSSLLLVLLGYFLFLLGGCLLVSVGVGGGWFLGHNLRYSPKSLKELSYMSLVRSKLEYCASIWDPHFTKDTDKLERVNRRAARFVSNDYRWRSSVTSMLQDLGWQDLASRRRNIRLALFYKIVHHLVAVPTDDLLIKADSRLRAINTNSRPLGLIVTPTNSHFFQELLLNGTLSPRTLPRPRP